MALGVPGNQQFLLFTHKPEVNTLDKWITKIFHPLCKLHCSNVQVISPQHPGWPVWGRSLGCLCEQLLGHVQKVKNTGATISMKFNNVPSRNIYIVFTKILQNLKDKNLDLGHELFQLLGRRWTLCGVTPASGKCKPLLQKSFKNSCSFPVIERWYASKLLIIRDCYDTEEMALEQNQFRFKDFIDQETGEVLLYQLKNN